jgi:hypothetical protein
MRNPERDKLRDAELQRRIAEVRDSWDDATRLKRARMTSKSALGHCSHSTRRGHDPGYHVSHEHDGAGALERFFYLQDHDKGHD